MPASPYATELAKPEYSGLTAEQVLARLWEDVTVPVTRWVDERSLYNIFGPVEGETILQTFEAVAASTNALAGVLSRVRAWMKPNEEGIDVGAESTRAMLDQLSGTIISPEQCVTLKSLGQKTAKRWETLGLPEPHLGDIQFALAPFDNGAADNPSTDNGKP